MISSLCASTSLNLDDRTFELFGNALDHVDDTLADVRGMVCDAFKIQRDEQQIAARA